MDCKTEYLLDIQRQLDFFTLFIVPSTTLLTRGSPLSSQILDAFNMLLDLNLPPHVLLPMTVLVFFIYINLLAKLLHFSLSVLW